MLKLHIVLSLMGFVLSGRKDCRQCHCAFRVYGTDAGNYKQICDNFKGLVHDKDGGACDGEPNGPTRQFMENNVKVSEVNVVAWRKHTDNKPTYYQSGRIDVKGCPAGDAGPDCPWAEYDLLCDDCNKSVKC
jgi:hypothetical protein